MGGACGTYGGREMDTGLWLIRLKRRDEGVDERIILKPIFKKIELVGVDWIKLPQVGTSDGLF
jgi:hypothetical protein